MKSIYLSIIAILTLVACVDTDERGSAYTPLDVTNRDAIGFYSIDGVSSVVVERLVQSCTNDERLQFRLQSSDQQSFVNVTFGATPNTVGQEIAVEIESKGVNFVSEVTSVKVVKLSEDSVWLTSDKAGFIVPKFNE